VGDGLTTVDGHGANISIGTKFASFSGNIIGEDLATVDGKGADLAVGVKFASFSGNLIGEDLVTVDGKGTNLAIGAKFASFSGNFVGNGYSTVEASGSSLVVNGLSSSPLSTSGTNLIQTGRGNTAFSIENSVILGVNNSIDTYKYSSEPYFAQSNFVAGSGNTLYNNNSWVTYGNFIQGQQITCAYGRASFIQGVNINAPIDFDTSFCQGRDINILDNSFYNLIQGTDHSISGVNRGVLVGQDIAIVTNCANIVLAGLRIEANGAINAVGVGTDVEIVGSQNLIVGLNQKIIGDNNIAVGSNADITGSNCIAHGASAGAIRDDQRAFGHRYTAQKSFMVKYLETTSAFETTLVTLDLEEDKTYGIRLLASVKNTTTDDQSASFELSNALAYRNTSGAAVLANDPIAISGIAFGPGAHAWEAKLMASGNDILLRVTGDTSDTLKWGVDFEFVEVRG